jgi:hypothetical protein
LTSTISSHGSTDTLRKESNRINRKKSDKNKRQTMLKLSSPEKNDGALEDFSQSPWFEKDLSLSDDFSLRHRDLIRFYENPLQHLPQSIDARYSCSILHCNQYFILN